MQAKPPFPDFDYLQNALEDARIDLHASEAHGIICGTLCAATKGPASEWVSVILGEADVQRKQAVATLSRDLLVEHQHLAEQLQTGDLEFRLLLPGDERPLALRVEALARWCQGFLYGAAAVGFPDTGNLPATSAEILGDLVDISGVEAEPPRDQAERDYAELVEYVRVGVQTLYEELRRSADPRSSHGPGV